MKYPLPVLATRRDNLRAVLQSTSRVEVMTKLGMSNTSFLSHIAGPNPSRKISEGLARKIESALGLGSGFLDVNRGAA